MKRTLIFFILFISCNKNNHQKMDVTIKYYSSFAGYEHPVKLIDELNENQIKDRRVYMIGTFVNGKLIKVDKILDNETAFIYYYSYDKNGNLLRLKIKNVINEKNNYIYFTI